MSEELGPCPLCGCEGGMIGETYRAAYCLNNACEMFDASVPIGVWYRLSAMFADAKLGRLVRRLADDRRDLFLKSEPDGVWWVMDMWSSVHGWETTEDWTGKTPEEALERAMGEGK